MRRFLYLPICNVIIRNLLRIIFFNKVPEKFQIPVNGKLKYVVQGKNIILHTNETCYVTQLIYWNNGPLGYEYTRLFIELIKECDVFLDIGSQLGYYSIIAKKVNPNVEVHAFEPSPGPLHYLYLNLKENDLKDSIHLHQIALSDKNGIIRFYENYSGKFPYVKYPLKGGNNFNIPSQKAHNIVDVESMTMDSFVESRNLKNISLIKIDTEGTENIIFANGTDTIKKFRPIVICEILKMNKECGIDLVEFFTKENYAIYYYYNNRLFLLENSNFDIVPDKVADYFFFPIEKMSIIDVLNNL